MFVFGNSLTLFVAQAGLEHKILVPQLQKHWNYTRALTWLASFPSCCSSLFPKYLHAIILSAWTSLFGILLDLVPASSPTLLFIKS